MATVIRGSDNFDTADNATQTELDSGLSGKLDTTADTGKVLQVKYKPFTSRISLSNVGYGNWTAISGIAESITPTSASSKIYVVVTGTMYHPANDMSAGVTIFRDSSNLASQGYGLQGLYFHGMGGAEDFQNCVSIHYLDSPNTTASTTYTVKYHTDKAGSYWNGLRNSDGGMLLMEVEG